MIKYGELNHALLRYTHKDIHENIPVEYYRRVIKACFKANNKGLSWDVQQAADLRLTRNFKDTRTWSIPRSTGEHGGADAKLKDLLFIPETPDPLQKRAGSRAGVMSSLIGIAAGASIETGKRIKISELIDFTLMWQL